MSRHDLRIPMKQSWLSKEDQAKEEAIRMFQNDGWEGSGLETDAEIARLRGRPFPANRYPPATIHQKAFLVKRMKWSDGITRRGAWALIHHILKTEFIESRMAAEMERAQNQSNHKNATQPETRP